MLEAEDWNTTSLYRAIYCPKRLQTWTSLCTPKKRQERERQK